MAFPGTYNFNYYRGDTHSFTVYPKTSTGASLPLSDYTTPSSTVLYTISNARGSNTNKKYADAVIVNNNSVICTIFPSLGDNLTKGTWVYDVQLSNGSDKVLTVITGTITVQDDISGRA